MRLAKREDGTGKQQKGIGHRKGGADGPGHAGGGGKDGPDR